MGMRSAFCRGVASFDDVLTSATMWVPSAARVLVAWDRDSQRAAVVGLRDEFDVPLDLVTVVSGLSNLFPHRVPAAVLHWCFEVEGEPPQVLLDIGTGESAVSHLLANVAEAVRAGLQPPDWVVRSAVWCVLDAFDLPSGAVSFELGSIEKFFTFPDGTGESTDWNRAKLMMGADAAELVEVCVLYLVDDMREMAKLGGAEFNDGEVLVSLM